MLLAIDIGNTALKFGLYTQEKLVNKYKIFTNRKYSSDEYFTSIKAILISDGINLEDLRSTIISSVVPEVSRNVSEATKKITGTDPIFINQKIKTKTKISIDYPNQLGSDLLVDVVSASHKYDYPLIVADLGTANKLLVVDRNRAYVGGIILPGFDSMLKSLVTNTSLLSEINLEYMDKSIGKNSKDSMNIGIVNGGVESLKGLVEKIKEDYPIKTLVLTGGYAPLVKEQMQDFVHDENLLLDGLAYIYKINFGEIL